MHDHGSNYSTPRWVKVSWIITGVLMLSVVVLLHLLHADGSSHLHTPSADASDQTPLVSVTKHGGQHP